MEQKPAVWFPTVRCGTGTDIFTETVVHKLRERGVRAEITWLPLRAEYAPWTVAIPEPPEWATVVHVNTWLHSRFLPKNLPIVATIHHSIHDPALRPYKGWLRAAYHRWWIAPNERRVLKQAAHITAVSKYAADIAKKTLCEVPIQVVYNGIEIEAFQPGNQTRKPGEPFRLLYVGSWMARKGVDLLAPIMQELGDDFVLNYTGGPVAEKAKTSMPANMQDLGRLNKDGVIKAMQTSDALLFPSRSEGFSLVVIEAMACGLPVIATRGSSLSEAIEDNVSGILCNMDDVASFVKAVKKISNDDRLRHQISHQAHSRAENKFTQLKMVSRYQAIYSNDKNQN
jgi:glycosyltransferase involved in cell wall biosynthesis